MLPAVYPRPLVEGPVHAGDDELMRPMHKRDLATLGNEVSYVDIGAPLSVLRSGSLCHILGWRTHGYDVSHHRTYMQIKSLPRLKSLTMGRMAWPTWDFTALCGSMEATEEVVREPSASERRLLKAGAWSNGAITEVNLSLVVNLSDEQLKVFEYCRTVS